MWKRFIFATDNHGDMQDDEAVTACLRFTKSFKPHYRIHGGDCWDFRALRKKASDEERRDSMVSDFGKGVQFLEAFKPTHFLRGNHDERLWDWSQVDNGIISDFAMQGCNEIKDLMEKLNCKMLPYDKSKGIVRIGSLKMIHGFLAGITAARRTALCYGSVLMGHGHAIDYAAIEGLDRRMGRMVGCLCQLNMEYNRHQLGALRHAHGFAYGVVNDNTGAYIVRQAERIGTQWSFDIL